MPTSNTESLETKKKKIYSSSVVTAIAYSSKESGLV